MARKRSGSDNSSGRPNPKKQQKSFGKSVVSNKTTSQKSIRSQAVESDENMKDSDLPTLFLTNTPFAQNLGEENKILARDVRARQTGDLIVQVDSCNAAGPTLDVIFHEVREAIYRLDELKDVVEDVHEDNHRLRYKIAKLEQKLTTSAGNTNGLNWDKWATDHAAKIKALSDEIAALKNERARFNNAIDALMESGAEYTGDNMSRLKRLLPPIKRTPSPNTNTAEQQACNSKYFQQDPQVSINALRVNRLEQYLDRLMNLSVNGFYRQAQVYKRNIRMITELRNKLHDPSAVGLRIVWQQLQEIAKRVPVVRDEDAELSFTEKKEEEPSETDGSVLMC